MTDTTQLWASTNYYGNNASASAGTEFWGTSGDRFNTTRAGAATAFLWNTSTRDLVQLQRVFSPEELGGNEAAVTKYDEYTYDVAAGIRGSFADRFDWEAYGNYGYYNYRMDRPRLLAQAVHNYFLGPRAWAGPAPAARSARPAPTRSTTSTWPSGQRRSRRRSTSRSRPG
ncbi:hypothetical protein H1235_11380 [Pseudoxanthomonas sp. NC8]|nr:hypothetical protein H1235_11380 [Pseudoxanthomonas sp. NC8]